jgi:regulator of RNase E activity RraA
MNTKFIPGDYIYADLDGIIISKKELDLKWTRAFFYDST